MINVALFGRTGNGKSSIANMLIQGDINENNVFKIGDGARGETVNIYSSMTENYQVFDMVGLGEPPSHDVSHSEAVKKIRDYFSECNVPLNYIFYIQKKGRITEEDVKMFKIFKEIFGWAKRNFIIIITHCNPEWVNNGENLETIRNDFGDYPIIPVDFPLTDEEGDEYVARYHKNKREQSLQRLEAKLSELRYREISLEILSSSQAKEKKVSEVINLVPVVGSVYQLIASSVYYKLGKPNQAKERLVDGAIGVTLDVMGAGVAGVSKSVASAIAKDTAERVAYKTYTKIKNYLSSKDDHS